MKLSFGKRGLQVLHVHKKGHFQDFAHYGKRNFSSKKTLQKFSFNHFNEPTKLVFKAWNEAKKKLKSPGINRN